MAKSPCVRDTRRVYAVVNRVYFADLEKISQSPGVAKRRFVLRDQAETERRASPRISGPIPAVTLNVRGGDELGAPLLIDNLSAGGFYVRLARSVGEDERIFIVTQISQAVIVMRGAPLRSVRYPDGTCGQAFSILQHQIFSLVDGGAKQDRVCVFPDM